MKLLTQELRKKLPKLYSTEDILTKEKVFVVKFFTPDSNWTWYAVEFDGVDTFFGWVRGFEDEWGYFSLSELENVTGALGLHVERDIYFEPMKVGEVMREYHDEGNEPADLCG